MNPSPSRLVIGSRDSFARLALRRVCAGGPVRVVGEAVTVREFSILCQEQRPDVAVVIDRFVDGSVEDCLDDVARVGCQILLVSADDAEERIASLLLRGVSGFLTPDASPDEVTDAARTVGLGDPVLHPSVARTLLRQWRQACRVRCGEAVDPSRTTLTGREREVLDAMVRGLSTKGIGRELGVAVKTVENHKMRIFDKLGVRTNAQAVSVALHRGVLLPAPVGGSSC